MPRCEKCRTRKPLDKFAKEWICHQCTPPPLDEKKERKRVAQAKWRKKNQKADTKYSRDYAKTKEGKAQQRVRDDVKAGYVRKPTKCDRCHKDGLKGHALQAHHHDYDKPLEIEWLCHDCHGDQQNAEKTKEIKH